MFDLIISIFLGLIGLGLVIAFFVTADSDVLILGVILIVCSKLQYLEYIIEGIAAALEAMKEKKE